MSLDTIPIGDAVSIPLTFAIAWKESKAVSLAIKSLLLHNPERGDAAQNWVSALKELHLCDIGA